MRGARERSILPQAWFGTQCSARSLAPRSQGTRKTMSRTTTTLSRKFRISIPKAVREQQHWKAGQEFVFIPKGKGALLMPVPDLAQLRGLAKGADPAAYRDREDRH